MTNYKGRKEYFNIRYSSVRYWTFLRSERLVLTEVAPLTGWNISEHYFSDEAKIVANRFIKQARQAQAEGQPLPGWLEEELLALLDNTWGDTAKAMVNNWLGLVYQVTNLDRNQQFMDEVDPEADTEDEDGGYFHPFRR